MVARPAVSDTGDTPHCTTESDAPAYAAPRADSSACSERDTATEGGGCATTREAGSVKGAAAVPFGMEAPAQGGSARTIGSKNSATPPSSGSGAEDSASAGPQKEAAVAAAGGMKLRDTEVASPRSATRESSARLLRTASTFPAPHAGVAPLAPPPLKEAGTPGIKLPTASIASSRAPLALAAPSTSAALITSEGSAAMAPGKVAVGEDVPEGAPLGEGERVALAVGVPEGLGLPVARREPLS